MRSALAGTASNVVALKTTAAVPMSVIERMFHLLCGVANNNLDRTQFLKLKLEIYLGCGNFLRHASSSMRLERFQPQSGRDNLARRLRLSSSERGCFRVVDSSLTGCVRLEAGQRTVSVGATRQLEARR